MSHDPTAFESLPPLTDAILTDLARDPYPIDFQEITMPTEPAPTATADDLLMSAWGLLANVSEGQWSEQTEEWQEAVVRWRDEFHAHLASEVER